MSPTIWSASTIAPFSRSCSIEAVKREDPSARLLGPVGSGTEAIHLALDKNGDGKLSKEEFIARPPKKPSGKKPAEKKPAPSVRVGEIRLNGGKVRLDDRLPAGGFRTEARDLSALVTGLATKGEDAADYELSFSTIKGEHFEVAGDLALEPGQRLVKSWPVLSPLPGSCCRSAI